MKRMNRQRTNQVLGILGVVGVGVRIYFVGFKHGYHLRKAFERELPKEHREYYYPGGKRP